MKSETLLKRLQTIKECTTGDITELQSLINDIKLELMSNDLKTSDKQRLKTCLSYCEKMYKGKRPLLAFTHFEDNYQYFTNAAFLVRLTGEDIMKDLPRHDETYQFKTGLYEPEKAMYEYPHVSNIVRIVGERQSINSEELYKFCKANKGEYVDIIIKDHTKTFFANELLMALTFGNCFNCIASIYSQEGLKPITIVKDNGTTIVVCPIRTSEGVETNYSTFKIN